MTDTITDVWTQRLTDARTAVETARSLEEQAIRDAHAAGMRKSGIARALGTEDRTRIDRILKTDPETVDVAYPTPVVYLRGAGIAQSTWDRVYEAMWRRGWATTPDRTRAWHAARGGAPTVIVDFSALADDSVTVAPVEAKYLDGDSEPELVVPRRRRPADYVDGGDFYQGWRRTRPVTVDRVTDVEVLARWVAEALAGVGPDGW